MDPLTAILIFAANFTNGLLYARFVHYVNQQDATKAATCSVAISALMLLGIMECFDNRWYLVPLLAGNWLGVYAAVQPQKQMWRFPVLGFLFRTLLVLLLIAIAGHRAEARDWPLVRGSAVAVRGAGRVVLPPYPVAREAGKMMIGVDRRQARRARNCRSFGCHR